jgi:hypothetical protein
MRRPIGARATRATGRGSYKELAPMESVNIPSPSDAAYCGLPARHAGDAQAGLVFDEIRTTV